MSSKKITYLVLSVVAILAVGYFVVPKVVNQQKQTNNNQVACTMEAKICPDGSSVGRVGLNCEFALCPEVDKHADWQTYKDMQNGLEFKYPKELGANYITPQEWPLKVSFVKGDFNCQAQDGSASLPSRIISTTISGKTYCVEAMSEGAAGSTYTTYVYSVKKNDGVLKADFIFRYPQCLNYDDPQKTACQTERTNFNLDNLVDEILSTVVFTENISANDKPIVDYPKPSTRISSPLTVLGQARGNWFFEASFPIQLVDANNNVIVQGIAQAKGDWMTTDFVPFSAELKFIKPTGQSTGYLILKKDNPSGLPQNDDQVKIPVIY